MDIYGQAFKEEAYELLSALETALLDLEESPDDMDAVGRVFRALHTIKGSGSMFGFDDLAAFTHEVETAFDLVRNHRLAVSRDLLDIALAASDQIRALLAASEGEGPKDNEDNDDHEGAERIVKALKDLIPDEAAADAQAPGPAPDTGDAPGLDPLWDNAHAFAPENATPVRDGQPGSTIAPPSQGQQVETYRIRFKPHPDIFLKGINPLLLINELRELGECSVVAHTSSIPKLDDINPEKCFTHWDVILTTSMGQNAIRDVFIFVEDDCDLHIEVIDDPGDPQSDETYRKLGEILVDRGALAAEKLEEVLRGQRRIGDMLTDAGLISETQLESALAEQKHVRGFRRKQMEKELASSVKVPAEKLDVLVDLVGELVTVQARLTQTAASRNDTQLASIAEEVERLTAELRDNTMSIRMLPIGSTFNRFKRLVRDLSRELGKEVALTTEGAETELDKTVIERLSDPLVHLIRNSIDHGIEPPDEREASGKARQGTVHLSAAHSGASVLIRITDDGAGLNKEAIRAKAVENGLIAPDTELSEKEVFSLILAPGFSTAREISNVSGRGVGMDVVKQNIEELRGSIELSSQRGEHTTITLKLPLTLAIVDGLLVQIGEGYFVVPLSIVEECVELTRDDVERAHGRQMSYVRGEFVPYIRLREQFGVNGGQPEIEQIVITEAMGGRFGLVVDKVVGEHQTVIKNLGRIYRDVEGISGATILGDGTVALILDVSKLVQAAEMQEQRAN